MRRFSFPWFWILLPALILVLPGPLRRIVLDLLGGLTLTLLLLPLLVGGLAVIGWQVLRRRLRTCEVCGVSSLGAAVCPACGTPFPGEALQTPAADPSEGGGLRFGRRDRELDPRDVTINVEAVDVGDETSGATPPPADRGEPPPAHGARPPTAS